MGQRTSHAAFVGVWMGVSRMGSKPVASDATALQSVPVLLYHSVSDDTGSLFVTSPRRFSEHTRAIVAAGRTGMTASSFAECLQGAGEWPENPIVVTLDDGHLDSVDALETLAENGLPATVYVATSLIGSSGRLDASGLRHLADLPYIEIGAHSVHHERLDELPRTLAEREIRDSRRYLEDITQQPIGSFAYPFGAYDRWVRDVVVDAGFDSAAAVKGALSRPGDDPHAFARLAVLSTTTARTLDHWMEGRGAPVVGDGEVWWKSAERGVRRMRRRIRGL
jgi:peptidoglycan/xylan/chitin deacetylase (PgdA/CDA1 family)